MGQHVQNDVSDTRPLVMQADRFHWQRAATRELAAILEAHPGLPAIAWSIGPAGALAGRINGLTASAAEVRATFGAWRDALGLNERARQLADDGPVTHLRASTRRGTVPVTITANVFPDEPARDTAGTVVRPGQRRAVRRAQLPAGPPVRPRLPEAPQPGTTFRGAA
jgi:hypothetical protein